MYQKDYGKILKPLRNILAWTQEELGASLGCTGKDICRWEKGATRPGVVYQQRIRNYVKKVTGSFALFDNAPEFNVSRRRQEKTLLTKGQFTMF